MAQHVIWPNELGEPDQWLHNLLYIPYIPCACVYCCESYSMGKYYNDKRYFIFEFFSNIIVQLLWNIVGENKVVNCL